jgi:hypothetical protein
MMLLESKIVPAMVKVLKGTTTEETVDSCSKQLASDVFSDFANTQTIDYLCYGRLTKALDDSTNAEQG